MTFPRCLPDLPADAPFIEAAALMSLGIIVLSTNRTVSSILRSIRRHPAGALAMWAAGGALAFHLLIEEDP